MSKKNMTFMTLDCPNDDSNYFSADDFNKFFINSAIFFHNNIKEHFVHPKNNNEFKFNLINSCTISKYLPKILNKSKGHLGIAPQFLQIFDNEIPNVISNCINFDINNDSFDDHLKTSIVTPILKIKNKPNDITNYRPISNINNMSKLFENIIYDQIENYLNINNLIYNNQFGFRKNLNAKKCF